MNNNHTDSNRHCLEFTRSDCHLKLYTKNIKKIVQMNNLLLLTRKEENNEMILQRSLQHQNRDHKMRTLKLIFQFQRSK